MNLPLAHVWQPARTASQQLMIVMHGRGDSPQGFLWLQDALEIDSLNFLLLQAPEPCYTGFSWYDLPPHQYEGIMQSRTLLGEVLVETEKSGYAPAATFLLGFSQGCLMTLEFGARHSARLRGYLGISGYCYDPEALLREMNPDVNGGDWLITHGSEDDVLPVEETREQIRRLQAGGFQIDYREYVKPHTIDFEQELPEIRDWLQTRLQGGRRS